MATALHEPSGASCEFAHVAEFLVSSGQLRQSDVDSTRRLAEESSQSLGLMLTRVGLVSYGDLAAAYARVLQRPLLQEDEIPVAPLEGVPLKESFLRDGHILPLADSENALDVATADPENEFALRALEMAVRKRVTWRIATLTQVEQTLNRWFGEVETREDFVDEGQPSDADTIDRLRDLASQAPVVKLVNTLLQKAIEVGASDLHIEPYEGNLRVRFRVDGMLKTLESLPGRLADAVVSRVKLMSKMNIAERRLPQDGRMQMRIQGTQIDFRVSTVPTVGGESLVLRVLDQERAQLELGALGFSAGVERRLGALVKAPNGIVLVTGPTGSGKTTTLYALLKQINTEERKLVTIEDPVEYQLPGVNQIQVKPQIGLDFATSLRSIVRQDPDIILVGEMRDLETARIAIQSALTGHLVLSTLHTNDAGSTVTRLLDMGIEDYLLTSSVNAILAQRLVRSLCTKCREPFEPPAALISELGLSSDGTGASSFSLYRARGCQSCDGSGYSGRTVISELLTLNEEVCRAILSGSDGKAIQKLARDAGMATLREDGLGKASAGVTTIEEIARVTQST